MSFPNDSSRIARGLGNLEASTTGYTTDADTAARSLIRKTYCITQVASVLANGDDAIVANASPGVFCKNAVRVLGVTVQARADLTEHTSDIQNISLKVVSAAGVIGNTIATANTDLVASGGVGNLIAGQSFSLTVDSTNDNFRVPAGSWMNVAIAPAASGVAIGATSWAIDVEEEGPDGYAV